MKKALTIVAVMTMAFMTGTAFARIINYHYYQSGAWHPMTVDPISDATEIASGWASSCFASGPSGTYRYHTTDPRNFHQRKLGNYRTRMVFR